MSTTVEIELLDDSRLDESPPCTIWDNATNYETQCGRPSVARIKVKCAIHGIDLEFVCAQCLRDAEDGYLECDHCEMTAELLEIL
jgi:hypothetical protein